MMKIVIISLLLILFGCNQQNSDTLWPNGVIKFVPIGLNDKDIEIIIKCMVEWEIASLGAIRFEITDQIGDGILHIMYNYNVPISNNIGYNKNRSIVILLNSFDKRTILHELGHVIGLEHEHQRPDRDYYIYIDYDRIKQICSTQELIINLEQIKIKNPCLYDYRDFPYDYNSITHYNKSDSSNCITAIIDKNMVLGNNEISFIDGLKVYEMYKNQK